MYKIEQYKKSLEIQKATTYEEICENIQKVNKLKSIPKYHYRFTALISFDIALFLIQSIFYEIIFFFISAIKLIYPIIKDLKYKILKNELEFDILKLNKKCLIFNI